MTYVTRGNAATFEHMLDTEILSAALPPRPLSPDECQAPGGQRCRLCHAINIEYPAEVTFKNAALQKFWKTLRISTPLDPLVESPRGRHYRTTTKRRVFPYRDTIRLGLISPNEKGEMRPLNVGQCAIEPIEHEAIYRQIRESLVKPYAKKLAKELSYVIIKGSYTEQSLIFNVKNISPEALRAANTLSKSLTNKFPGIVGVFLYEDSSSPQYYLGSKNQNAHPKFKKLFGKPEIFHRTLGKSFLYSPLSFSQINQSIIEKMILTAKDLLRPSTSDRLFDLYCGYGLFALCLAESVQSVVGAEVSPSSIEAATANARRQRVTNARFIRGDINEETIERILTGARPNDIVLLDPPRKGTSAGVIEYIAERQPRRVVHIFCDIELIAKELKRWQKSGYTPRRAIPFDMFPGTATMEVMILLEPKVA